MGFKFIFILNGKNVVYKIWYFFCIGFYLREGDIAFSRYLNYKYFKKGFGIWMRLLVKLLI